MESLAVGLEKQNLRRCQYYWSGRTVSVIGLSCCVTDALKRDTCRLEIRKCLEPAEDQNSATPSQ